MIRIPPFIQKDDPAGYIAPSFGCAVEPYHSAFKNAVKTLREDSHPSVLGPNCFESSGTGISSTPQACAQEFMQFYTDPETKALFSCGGGELMCEILPFIDWDVIKSAPPKWFMGYSDNTNITFLLTTICSTAAVYGPNAPAFGMVPRHASVNDALALLEGRKKVFTDFDLYEKESLKTEEAPLTPYNLTEPAVRRIFPGTTASMSGLMLGGCLDILSNLAGTRFDHVDEFLTAQGNPGVIWFLEACDLNVFSIRRALWQLKECGWFRTAAGFIIGRPGVPDEMFGLDRFRAVTDILAELNVPIVMDADLGHIPPMVPMVSGAYADVTADAGHLRIGYRL